MNPGQLWAASIYISLIFFLLSLPWVYVMINYFIPIMTTDKGPSLIGLGVITIVYLFIIRFLVLPYIF